MNDLMLDLHGNTLSEGDVVKHRNGYFATIVKKEGKLAIKYDSGYCYYLDDSQAVRLEKVANPELFFLGQE